MKIIGRFKVESGKLHISDPCYDKGDGAVVKVPNGTYVAKIGTNKDGRVSSLVVTHSTAKPTSPWYPLSDDLGVDSGQMSIFDLKFFKNPTEAKDRPQPKWMDKKRIKERGEKFYGACCSLTCGDDSVGLGGGVLAHGAVSESGYGDGSYTGYQKLDDKGRAVAVKVRFT